MPRKIKGGRKWIVTAAVVVAAIAAVSFLPLQSWADALQSWFEGRGAAGILLFVLAYVIGTLFFLPVWLLTVVAGAIFGLVGGFAISMVAAMAGALSAFLVARYAIRERVRRYFSRNSLLRAVDKALRKAGWKAVALLRLSPLVPFTVQNYFFGATQLKLRHFVAGTALGIIPGTALEIFIGSSGRSAMGGGGPLQWTLLGVGIVATVAVSWYVGRIARKQLGIRR